jgi:hypothetical protein
MRPSRRFQNKVGKALMVPSLRNMLAQPKSTITLRRLMDEGAIVVCNLSKGALGESTAHLLGALITTALVQAALSRADTPATQRRVFHLYAQYALTLTIGHQYLDHRRFRQRRLDHRLSIRSRGRRSPRPTDWFGRFQCTAGFTQLHGLGAAVATRHTNIPHPARPLRRATIASARHESADRYQPHSIRSRPSAGRGRIRQFLASR